MPREKLFNEVKVLTECDNDALVQSLVDLSIRKVLSLTNRTEMIDELYQYALDYSLARYNQLGNEGQSTNNEGGVSVTYSQDDVFKGIEQYRLNNIVKNIRKALK